MLLFVFLENEKRAHRDEDVEDYGPHNALDVEEHTQNGGDDNLRPAYDVEMRGFEVLEFKREHGQWRHHEESDGQNGQGGDPGRHLSGLYEKRRKARPKKRVGRNGKTREGC